MSKPPTLWNRDFFLLWQGSVVSALGSQAYSIAVMLWAKQVTESGTAVGAIMFAGGITSLLMPFGGVLADRYSRTRLLVLLDCLTGVCVLALAALFYAFPGDSRGLVAAVLAINFVRGACMALFHPVATALVPDLVPDEALTRAHSSLQSAYRVTSLIGQGIGGILFRVMGAPLLMLVDGISFLLSGFSEWFIREPAHSQDRAAGQRPGILTGLSEGMRFTGRIRGFRIYLAEASCANFFMAGLTVSLPFLVEDVYRASVDWYGYLLAAMGFGAVVGAFLARWFPAPGVRRGTIQIACLAVMSSCPLLISIAPSEWAALAIIVVSWTCIGFHQVLLTTLVQKRTPKEMRGRVGGLLSMIRFGLTPLGMAIFGVLIDKLGGVTSLLFWTGLAGLVTILGAVLQPDYRWFFTGDDREVEPERDAERA